MFNSRKEINDETIGKIQSNIDSVENYLSENIAEASARGAGIIKNLPTEN